MNRSLLTLRLVLFALTALAFAGFARAAEPRFTVVNKCPQFTVVNKMPAAPDDGYTGQPAPAGFQWQKVGAAPWQLVKVVPEVASASPATFPVRGAGLPFHADHTCPQCGRSQFTVERFLPSGQHVHTCSAGHSWFH